jgi:outer membrane protein OmpA-like peptidoglycan-associated protein
VEEETLEARNHRTQALGTALLAISIVGTMGCAAHRYDARGNHYYEARAYTHATEGAVLGGLAGAGVGRLIAGHRHDEAGYWIGGALGALTGAVIGDAIDREEARGAHPYPPAPPPPPYRRGPDPYDHDRGPDPYDHQRGPHPYDHDDAIFDAPDDHDEDDGWRDAFEDGEEEPSPRFLSLPDEVLFEPDSDRLQPGAQRRLRSVAQALRQHPGTVVVVRGHASRSERGQTALAEARARAVREYLLHQGVAPSRVTALGMDARFPVASERSAEGRQRNRRAEIELRSARGHDLAGLW